MSHSELLCTLASLKAFWAGVSKWACVLGRLSRITCAGLCAGVGSLDHQEGESARSCRASPADASHAVGMAPRETVGIVELFEAD
jgi:hypothetical protein